MKLNRFDPANIRVGSGGSGGGFPGGGGGKIGCGTLVIALIAALVFGVDPGQMLGTLENAQQQLPQSGPGQGQPDNPSTTQLCEANAYALEACNALSSLNATWEPLFRQANIPFEQPTLWFYTGGTKSGCGAAQSAMGPFYCPADQGIYIDTSFYDQLARQLGAPGDFARYYVIAHEYGHHIQKLTGIESQVRSAQQQNPSQANPLQVRMELQADCYAGVWAAKHRDLIEPGDMEEGLNAASQIGDDTLMRGAGQQVNPESFTHGSSAQRMQWLKRGLETGNDEACDTFADLKR
ncbi:KPN_02809 family neutral zinc metallopeptidase [Novosphingobium album (ex Liu et al. 2023)]|uniref:Neutral zinc metallopeptidase n=1 Tax=Novosphingobium album (ex Liu et al. 2023) TaxID=3031130 RepID=A0ABT5WT92_9SPHN|nr:neutral zinc metallopeptidase [Novosphingobium album (ex Liu et al. 2023)]MDE8652752.1 neutral zinc metallopeptidase [Novosphingobium album (ex Liu et al. 2023)]